MKNENTTTPTFASGLFIGLMSGTSLDGVDAVLVRFDPELKIEFAHTYALPATLVQNLLSLSQTDMPILLDDVDLFPTDGRTSDLACRVYRTDTGFAGVPTVVQLVEAIQGHA